MIPLNEESASTPVISDAFRCQLWVFCLMPSPSLSAHVNAVNWSRALHGFKMKCLYEILLTLSLLQTALVQRFMPAQGKGECGGKKRHWGMLGLPSSVAVLDCVVWKHLWNCDLRKGLLSLSQCCTRTGMYRCVCMLSKTWSWHLHAELY